MLGCSILTIIYDIIHQDHSETVQAPLVPHPPYQSPLQLRCVKLQYRVCVSMSITVASCKLYNAIKI